MILVGGEVLLAHLVAVVVDLANDRPKTGNTGGLGYILVVGPLSLAELVDVSYLHREHVCTIELVGDEIENMFYVGVAKVFLLNFCTVYT